MKAFQRSTNFEGTPIWAHDDAAFFNMVVQGAILKAATVPANPLAPGQVASGNIVGRIPGARKFAYIAPTATTLDYTNPTTLTVAAAAGATTVTVADVDGYAAGQAITINGEARTIASVNVLASTITITAGLTGAAGLGAAVTYTTPVAFTEVYLMFTSIEDVNVNAEFTQYRHQRAVYQNFLPNWGTMSTFLKGQLTSRYLMTEARA
jgi:hypothetical protein